MSGFSADEARRWDAWRHPNGLSGRGSDPICGIVGTLLAAPLIALAVVAWLR
ncbi:MAG TPA: hypothetical protein VIK60_04995 [Vicinamibacterales bacterium]